MAAPAAEAANKSPAMPATTHKLKAQLRDVHTAYDQALTIELPKDAKDPQKKAAAELQTKLQKNFQSTNTIPTGIRTTKTIANTAPSGGSPHSLGHTAGTAKAVGRLVAAEIEKDQAVTTQVFDTQLAKDQADLRQFYQTNDTEVRTALGLGNTATDNTKVKEFVDGQVKKLGSVKAEFSAFQAKESDAGTQAAIAKEQVREQQLAIDTNKWSTRQYGGTKSWYNRWINKKYWSRVPNAQLSTEAGQKVEGKITHGKRKLMGVTINRGAKVIIGKDKFTLIHDERPFSWQKTPGSEVAALRDLLEKARLEGWTDIEITGGNEKMQRLAWMIAKSKGLNPTTDLFIPTPEDDMKAQDMKDAEDRAATKSEKMIDDAVKKVNDVEGAGGRDALKNKVETATTKAEKKEAKREIKTYDQAKKLLAKHGVDSKSYSEVVSMDEPPPAPG